MRSKSGLLMLLMGCQLAACSVRPGLGTTRNGGSDVVEPLWMQTTSRPPVDTLRCTRIVALLIGIGQYEPASGWEKLNAQNDVELMAATLLRRGVEPARIHVLTDGQATKTAMLKALKTLADTVGRGSQILVLYAGHARQLPDDSGDETDGYDEAIVPYDAPLVHKFQPAGYLRDDELNSCLTQIRAALGPAGSLWLLFDACHAQTLHRGPSSPGLEAQRRRGSVLPMGLPAKTRPKQPAASGPGSDWYETPSRPANQLAPYVLFSASTDGGPDFETTDASGRSFGPLTRAVAEVWGDGCPGETYRTLFGRVATTMTRYAPYQQPGLEGDADGPVPHCGWAGLVNERACRTTGEGLRVAWPDQDMVLTAMLQNLPFVQRSNQHPDLRIDRRNGHYRLWATAGEQRLLMPSGSAGACAERIRQYFARRVLFQLQQTNPDFRVKATMQRVAVQTRQGQTMVTDTLPAAVTAGLPVFTISARERVVLTLTNTGLKPACLTVVDLQPDGTLHVLMPGAGQLATSYRLLPGQSLSQRIRMTEPAGAEVYKILLTPEPVNLRAVLQTRGNYPARHPYERLFQRSYVTRGEAGTLPIQLSDAAGATAEIAFWVKNSR